MVYLLHEAIDRAAEQFPDGEAVRCYEQSLSYRALVQKSNSLARLLMEQGVKRGDRVGIYMHKSLESVIAIYGIMKAGAAYVPIDPLSPVTRLAYIVGDCGIHHLIAQEEKRDILRQLWATKTDLQCLIGMQPHDDLPLRTLPWVEVYNTPGNDAPAVGTIELDLSYIMYTSGSTGEPKGIMHTHRSGLSYAKWAVQAYALQHKDRIANHAPLHFDISTFDVFAGALAGAAVVIVPEEYMGLPASYSELLADEKITVIFTVPFALVQLLLRGALPLRDLSALRWAIFGGEPFPTKHLRTLMAQLPQTRFSNIYGPAEVNGVTFYHVPPLSEGSDEPIPIGKLCPFAQGLVVDEQEQQVAEGEVGEFLIRSPTMMQGY